MLASKILFSPLRLRSTGYFQHFTRLKLSLLEQETLPKNSGLLVSHEDYPSVLIQTYVSRYESQSQKINERMQYPDKAAYAGRTSYTHQDLLMPNLKTWTPLAPPFP